MMKLPLTALVSLLAAFLVILAGGGSATAGSGANDPVDLDFPSPLRSVVAPQYRKLDSHLNGLTQRLSHDGNPVAVAIRVWAVRVPNLKFGEVKQIDDSVAVHIEGFTHDRQRVGGRSGQAAQPLAIVIGVNIAIPIEITLPREPASRKAVGPGALVDAGHQFATLEFCIVHTNADEEATSAES